MVFWRRNLREDKILQTALKEPRCGFAGKKAQDTGDFVSAEMRSIPQFKFPLSSDGAKEKPRDGVATNKTDKRRLF